MSNNSTTNAPGALKHTHRNKVQYVPVSVPPLFAGRMRLVVLHRPPVDTAHPARWDMPCLHMHEARRTSFALQTCHFEELPQAASRTTVGPSSCQFWATFLLQTGLLPATHRLCSRRTWATSTNACPTTVTRFGNLHLDIRGQLHTLTTSSLRHF